MFKKQVHDFRLPNGAFPGDYILLINNANHGFNVLFEGATPRQGKRNKIVTKTVDMILPPGVILTIGRNWRSLQ